MDGRRYTVVGITTVRLAALAALAAMFACATTATAQSVRGTVVQRDSSTRAPGVVVVASDERGTVVARALSAENGDFDLRLPEPGVYTLRLLRVGFRPTRLADVTVPAAGVSGLRAVLGGEAVVLSAVTVRSENVCGSTEDTGRVVAQLWEEARTALTATELSVGSAALDVEWQAFQFLMQPGGGRAQEQSVLPRRGATERPFVSVSADSLMRFGYVVRDRNDIIYRAPDAAALLSDQFAATHCFRVQPTSQDRAQWIGVAFRPTPARAAMGDIAGTLWLDRASAELRLLEFRYTNLPPQADDPAVGGFVEFVRLTTGQWLVARWAIRTPHMTRRWVGGAGIPGGGRSEFVALQAIGVTGGELIVARKGADSLYQADPALLAAEGSEQTVPARPSGCGAAQRPGAVLGGTVTSGSGPADGAVVTVSWAAGSRQVPMSLSTVSDKRGGFLIPCVARGVPLTVSASQAALRAGPEALAPISGARLVIDIELGPVPPRRP